MFKFACSGGLKKTFYDPYQDRSVYLIFIPSSMNSNSQINILLHLSSCPYKREYSFTKLRFCGAYVAAYVLYS